MASVELEVVPAQRRALSADAWANPTTGVGGPRDKLAGFEFYGGAQWLWPDERLSDLYEEDDMAARVVDALPTEAMRKGWTPRLSGQDAEAQGRVLDTCDRLDVTGNVLEARKWARLYGQAAIFLGADDGGQLVHPLIDGAVQRLHFLHTLEREELSPNRWQEDPSAPDFGKPLTYRISHLNHGGGHNIEVHASRLIVFDGVKTTKRKRIQRNGAGASVLLRVLKVLEQFNGSFAQSLAILGDANQNIYKMAGLAGMLRAPDGGAALKERLTAIDEARSAINALLLDAEKDDFIRSQIGALTGISDLLERFELRLSAAAETPLTVLLGQSPGGMNATGESDRAIWHARIESERGDHMLKPIERILRLIFASKYGPTGGRQPSNWKVVWGKLWEPTAKEQAEIDNINAQTDQVYADMGALTVPQIAKARFGQDEDDRPALSAQDIQALEARFGDPAAGVTATQLLADPEQQAMQQTAALPAPEQETTDEGGIDEAVMSFAEKMTAHGIEECPHGSKNRCRICGIERVRGIAEDEFGAVQRDPEGNVQWRIEWRAIGSGGAGAPASGTPALGSQ